MNSFNFVAEEQENEDRGSDGRGSKENNNNNNQGVDKLSNVDMQDVPTNLDGDHGTVNSPGMPQQQQLLVHQVNSSNMQYKNKRNNQKKSAIKNYGEIANQLLPHNTFE